MGLSKQKSSPIDSYKKFNQEASITEILCRNSAMLFQWVCQNRNPVLLIVAKSNTIHTRKQVLLKYCVSKQHNVISMGLSKQKSSPIDSYKKFNQEASMIRIHCVETAQCYFNGIVETEIQSY